jgi:hypothetical protein
MSYPSSRRCVAKECRSVWHVDRFAIPACRTALLRINSETAGGTDPNRLRPLAPTLEV